MAEGIVRGILEKEFGEKRNCLSVSSAGISALEGYPASVEAIIAMKEMGIDIGGHRGRKLEKSMIDESDIVLVMEESQKRYLRSLGAGNVFLLLALGRAAKELRSGSSFVIEDGSDEAILSRLGALVSQAKGHEKNSSASLSAGAFELIDPLGDSIEGYRRIAKVMEDSIREIIFFLCGSNICENKGT